MLNRTGDANPINVTPNSSANFIAKSVGAERLITIGNRPMITFLIVDAVCLQETTNTF
jgi:hypothetical protein